MQKNNKINKLKEIGIFNLKTANEFGFSKSTILRLVKDNQLTRVDRGIYIHNKSNISFEELDFIIAKLKFGNNSIICGLTALFYYKLINQVPTKIWVSVPKNIRTIDKKYKLLRVKTFTLEGIVKNKQYQMTNIERTLVEALQYANKIGIRTVITAIVKAIKEQKTTYSDINKMAKKLKLEKLILKYGETIIGALES